VLYFLEIFQKLTYAVEKFISFQNSTQIISIVFLIFYLIYCYLIKKFKQNKILLTDLIEEATKANEYLECKKLLNKVICKARSDGVIKLYGRNNRKWVKIKKDIGLYFEKNKITAADGKVYFDLSIKAKDKDSVCEALINGFMYRHAF
jgi:hypothetical protein